MTIRDRIASYVEELSRESAPDHSWNLFEQGLLTSLDVLSLVSFLESTFALDISGDDVDMESFGTIDGLVALVETKQAAVA